MSNSFQSVFGSGGGGGATLAANTFTGTQTVTLGAANTNILVSTGYSLTGSNTAAAIDLAGTWNTSGVASGIKLNITDTASGAGSKWLDMQRNSASWLYVTKTSSDPVLNFLRTGDATSDSIAGGGGLLTVRSVGSLCAQLTNFSATFRGIFIPTANSFGWADSFGNADLWITRSAAAHVKLGLTHATTATNQTISAHNVTTGTGADLILAGGTGSVANGNVRFGTHAAVGVELVTGYITIKDEGGTLRKLAVIS